MEERFILIVGTSEWLRTIQQPAMSEEHVAALRKIVKDVTPGTTKSEVSAGSSNGSSNGGFSQKAQAQIAGYTGDVCQGCGEYKMKRSGTCLTCESCGSTSGGCS